MKQERSDDAVLFLQRGTLDNRRITKPSIKEECGELLSAWTEVCSRFNWSHDNKVYGNDGNMILGMLETIACHLIDEERAYREGKQHDLTGEELRKSMWKNYLSLKAGVKD